MSDLESGHLPATVYLRPEPCQKPARRSSLFAFPLSYTLDGGETLRRKLPAKLSRRARRKTSSLIQREFNDFVPCGRASSLLSLNAVSKRGHNAEP